MKVVSIPPPVTVGVPKIDGRVVEFVDTKRTLNNFLQECIDMFDVFSKGHVNAMLYVKLTKILSESDPAKGEIWFEDEDFKKLQEAVTGSRWISPKMNAMYIPFYEAVKDARTEVLTKEKG